VIPTALRHRVPQAIECFRRLATERALDRPALVGVSSLKEMLAESLGADSTRHHKFAETRPSMGATCLSFGRRCVPLG
jgi:hypothetical protein